MVLLLLLQTLLDLPEQQVLLGQLDQQELTETMELQDQQELLETE
jgi:hypothetical protein